MTPRLTTAQPSRAVRERDLIVGLGDGEAESIAGRAWQDPPDWLQQLRRRLTVPRPANLFYVNVAEAMKLAAGDQPDFMKTLDGLGLTQIKSVASITGLDDNRPASRGRTWHSRASPRACLRSLTPNR